MQAYEKLNKKLILVRVPQVALYSEEELKLLGIPIDVIDGKEDKKSVTQYTTVMLPLSKILDIYSNGFTIRIVNSDEIPAIAEFLTEVLSLLEYSLNVSDTELKDKIKMFLDGVIELNKDYIVNKINEQINDDGLEDDLFMSSEKVRPKIDISKLEV